MRRLLVLGLLTGCAADDLCADPDADPALELRPDAVLAIGSQGGFHLWTHLDARGTCGDRTELQWEVVTSDGAAPVAAGAAPLFELPAMLPLQLCPAPRGIDLVDREVRLRASLLEDGAPVAGAEQLLILRCPDDRADVHNTCLLVCNGEPG